MSKKHIKFIFVTLSVLFLINILGGVQFCQAAAKQELQTQLDRAGQTGWGAKAETNAMPLMIQAVVSAFLGLLGIIFLVLIIYSGFNWMTAQGDEEKVTLAKNTLTRAIIGLVIIIAAYSITYFVFSSLPDGDGGAGAGTAGGGIQIYK